MAPVDSHWVTTCIGSLAIREIVMTESSGDQEGKTLGQWVKSNVSPLLTLATLITVVFTGYFWLEGHYASAEELAQLETRFEIKINNDLLQSTNTRIWQLEDRLQDRPDDMTAKEELRELKEDKSRLERKLELLEQRY
jgi:hypothetical protein